MGRWLPAFDGRGGLRQPIHDPLAQLGASSSGGFGRGGFRVRGIGHLKSGSGEGAHCVSWAGDTARSNWPSTSPGSARLWARGSDDLLSPSSFQKERLPATVSSQSDGNSPWGRI